MRGPTVFSSRAAWQFPHPRFPWQPAVVVLSLDARDLLARQRQPLIAPLQPHPPGQKVNEIWRVVVVVLIIVVVAMVVVLW